ncbi:MAG: PDZ domain-containing protein, partial [Gammaproteobacteria bacterium]|nr:PDZ domain-containing protein [Gammaproteobacteria bacterium]
MHKTCRMNSRAAALLAAALLAPLPGALLAADAPPLPPPLPAPPGARAQDDSDLDAQLERARAQLEQAAHQVARLSGKLSDAMIEQVRPFAEPHAIIGVQLEPAPGTSGARVREVSPGGPAAQAGIHSGDVIVAVNGSELAGKEPARQVAKIMRDVKPESKVSVRVLRDGKTQDYLVTARASPGILDVENWPDMRDFDLFHRPLMNMELATLTPRLGSYFGSDKGVLVVRAPADGALKLEDGDVIL